MLKALKEKELTIALKKSKMGGMFSSVVDETKVKLTQFGSHATIDKDVALGGAKFKIIL